MACWIVVQDLLLIQWYRAVVSAGSGQASVYHRLGALTAKIRVREQVRGNNANDLRVETIDWLRKALEADYRYLAAYRSLIPELMGQMDFVGLNQVMQRYYCVKREIARERRMDTLGVRFVPEAVFTGNYGSFVHLDAHLKSKQLGLVPPHESVALLPGDRPVSNNWMLKNWGQYVRYIDDRASPLAQLDDRFLIEDDINSFIDVNGKAVWTNEAVGLINKRWEEEGRGPLLALSENEIARGWEELRQLGIGEEDWFVALHVRESGYKNSRVGVADIWDDHRNADIRTYEKALNAIVERGGWVLRMGDQYMSHLDDMDRVVDYAHSPARSEFMDVFCCSQCRFYVGTNAGLMAFPEVFNRPMVQTNYVAMTARGRASNQLVLYKLLRSVKENRYLSFEEGLRPPIGNALAAVNYGELGVEWIDNSADELRDVVVEMLDQLDNRVEYTDEDARLQDEFNELHGQYSNWGGLGRVSRDFLRKYHYLLPE